MAGGMTLTFVPSAEILAKTKGKRYGMVFDVRRCTGCLSCTVNCSMENRIGDARRRTTVGPQKFCNRATKAFVALAHQMPSSFRNSWSRFTDSVLQRLIPRGVITEVVFTQSNHSRT